MVFQLSFPREAGREIDSILSLGIEVRTNVRIGRDIWLEELEKQYDCIYIAIGAHQDKRPASPVRTAATSYPLWRCSRLSETT